MQRDDRPWRPPHDELPAVLPAETILAKSPKATIALTAINVYSSCCLLDLDWMLRRTPEVEWTQELMETVLFRPFGRIVPNEPEPAIGRLRYSIEFADGRTARNDEPTRVVRTRALPDVALPLLRDAGGGSAHTGGGGDCYGHSHLFLWPLPPPGKLRLTLSWPAFAIPEHTNHHPGRDRDPDSRPQRPPVLTSLADQTDWSTPTAGK
jgi:hypothetical protein